MTTDEPRQRVERAGTGRRARLTPAPGTDVAPEAPTPSTGDAEELGTKPKRRRGSSDDERITRERPPHW
ncbi:hypothetical protein [Agromyces sp. H66]|uniref:hypothetical protein n=1 Tax=Agromyces sp. H66 TaxID=2529859 RepID=UPI0010AAA179|nr:hypothetical protein [Agromyces sp. H66]